MNGLVKNISKAIFIVCVSLCCGVFSLMRYILIQGYSYSRNMLLENMESFSLNIEDTNEIF